MSCRPMPFRLPRRSRSLSLESDGSRISGTWTPGGMIIRISNNQTNQYRVDLDPRTGKPVGAPIRLTEDSPMNVGAQVSPDGGALRTFPRGRPVGIALMDANGAHERVIKEVPPDMLAGWAPRLAVGFRSCCSDAKLGTGNMRDAPKQLMSLNVVDWRDARGGPGCRGPRACAGAGGNVLYVRRARRFFIRPIAGGPERDHQDRRLAGLRRLRSSGWPIRPRTNPAGNGKPVPGDIRVRSLRQRRREGSP